MTNYQKNFFTHSNQSKLKYFKNIGGPMYFATEITKASKNNLNYKSIYINPDLTESQQIHLKRLIKERTQKNSIIDLTTSDFRYGICGDQVVKINVKQFHHHDLL